MKIISKILFVLTIMPFLCCCSLYKNYRINYPTVIFDTACCDSFPIISLSGCDTITYIYNDFEYELLPEPLSIIGNNKNEYIISIIVDNVSIKGQVDKSIPLSIQLRQDGQIGVPIYKRPTERSAHRIIRYSNFISRTPCSYPTVYGYSGNWLKVAFYDEWNNIKYGWLNEINQCSNPYSTCN